MSKRGWILFLALSLIWGLPYLMIRVALREVDPGTLIFFRTVPAALLILPWAAWTGRLTPLKKHVRWLLVYTVVEFGIPWLLMTEAERHLSSSLAALLVACVPLLAVVIYHFTTARERFGSRRITGLLLGAFGVGCVVGLSIQGTSWIGVVLMVGCVIGYTVGPLIISTRLAHLPGPGVVGASIGLVALAYLPFGVTHLPSHMSLTVIGAVLVLSLVCTLAGSLIFFSLIVEVGPSRMTVVTYINPAVAILLGVVLLNEQLTIGMIIGFPLIVLGSILATSQSVSIEKPLQSPAE